MKKLIPGLVLVLALMACSLFTGVLDMPLDRLLAGDGDMWEVFRATRLPRTLALALAGMAMAITGTIMQLLTRNRFVEPATAGTMQSASLGLLIVALYLPGLPVFAKMLVITAFALAGTALFMTILQRLPLHSVLVVPLVGIMLGGIIWAVTMFFAYRHDMIQSLLAWTMGDFSAIMQGRYELLWLTLPLAVTAYIAADRFTVAGLGEAFTTNLGVNYRTVMTLGLIIVALVTAAIVVTVGQIPFLGLIVPNIVALAMGDNMRRTLPWTALCGAGLVLACDILGRIIRYPYEIPIGATMGVVGSVIFLYLLLRKGNRLA
ncbi:MAG: Iron compound ABC transporter permease protein [Candidatus Tokpelaia hoelldobleri]|uniref:Iron compound ABC transporter permease protein n=1 Tax=Candidatus Tokpelaia hoelldobleri TaxID=1902579 RepID=A0A1U9JTA7_9HYPH|nr:MAG: Iron compound ABC transporter permease protein [Candidatus Tokpelaia hoelldoblerii]